MFTEMLLEVEFALALVLAGIIALLMRIYRKRDKRVAGDDDHTHWI